MDLLDLLRILLRRWHIVLAGIAVTFALAVVGIAHELAQQDGKPVLLVVRRDDHAPPHLRPRARGRLSTAGHAPMIARADPAQKPSVRLVLESTRLTENLRTGRGTRRRDDVKDP